MLKPLVEAARVMVPLTSNQQRAVVVVARGLIAPSILWLLPARLIHTPLVRVARVQLGLVALAEAPRSPGRGL
jgi:hypothetical protein